MYYTRQEILQNYSTKADIVKLGYEELKDLWWSTFDQICGIETGSGYYEDELSDLYYIKDEAYRQIEERFPDEYENEFKAYVEKEENIWEEEVEEERYFG